MHPLLVKSSIITEVYAIYGAQGKHAKHPLRTHTHQEKYQFILYWFTASMTEQSLPLNDNKVWGLHFLQVKDWIFLITSSFPQNQVCLRP